MFLIPGSWVHLLHNTFLLCCGVFFFAANQREGEAIDTAG